MTPSLEISPEKRIEGSSQFADLIMSLSNEQVAEQSKKHSIDLEEFQLGCDGFNFNRVVWRLEEEFGVQRSQSELVREVIESICEARQYEKSDFLLVIAATKHRPRFPFGLNPLAEALQRASQRQFRLLPDLLQSSPACTRVAAVAYELQLKQLSTSILLPVDQISRLLRMRKLLVGAAVRQLVTANVISETDSNYFRGKARKFKFVGRPRSDFIVSPVTADDEQYERDRAANEEQSAF